MASSKPPGPQCSLRNPQNVADGTLCRQASPQPGILGSVWEGLQSTATWTIRVEAAGASYLLESGVSFVESEYAILGRFAHATLDEGKKLLNELVERIKNAADWNALNRLAEPILGETSLQLGVLYGVGESLTVDVLSLLGLAKMIVLAGLYERIKHADVASILDPTMTALALAAQAIPGLAAEMKKADEQLWKMLNELLDIVKHPIKFIEALGKSIKKETLNDFNKLKDYTEHPSVINDFQTGRIFGRVLYQVIMLILLVLSVAGAVAKLAARIPWLLRAARIIKAGGELEELEAMEKVQQTARAAEDVADAERISKTPRDGFKLHNKKWADVGIKDGSFEPTPPDGPVNLKNPANPQEAEAIETLRNQGRADDKIEQILNSGRDPEVVQLEKGDKLYGFTTEGVGKPASSPYWMTEDEFNTVKTKYYKDGVWDQQGVKDYLALPCFNQANSIVSAEVTQDTQALSTTINPATETTFYTDEFGKKWIVPDNLMSGGGSQITPPPSAVGNVQELPFP